jgi:hypothetical protein
MIKPFNEEMRRFDQEAPVHRWLFVGVDKIK